MIGLDAVTFSQVILQRLQHQTQVPVSREFLHGVDVGLEDVVTVYSELLAVMTKQLLTHKVDTTQLVPMRGQVQYRPGRSVLVELPQSRWARWLRRPKQRLWVSLGNELLHLPKLGQYMVLELEHALGVVRCPIVGIAAEGVAGPTVEVEGRVEVDVALLHTFPEAREPYPGWLGADFIRATPSRPRLVEPYGDVMYPTAAW